MRDYGRVDCDVAREALSARIDGEREPVPSARVDEHVRSCRRCAAWYTRACEQAAQLRGLAGNGGAQPMNPGARRRRGVGRYGLQAALALAGVLQIALAAVQAVGVDFGMVAAHHGAATGAHLLNESTAWCAALGLVTVAAAWRPALAVGLASVLVTYVALLSGYVIADAVAGQVTTLRIASHVPVAAAAVLAVLVWHSHRRGHPPPRVQDARDERTWPPRLRGVPRDEQLRPSDNSAA